MDKKQELIYIAKNTQDYLQTQGRALESRLEEIIIDQAKQKEIVTERALKTVVEKGLSLFGPVGEVVSTFLNWNEQVNEDISEAKKMVLLEQYFNKTDGQEQAIENMKRFLVDPQGNTLFNKILRILDDSPPDEELMQHLSSTLKVIVECGNFESLFDQHKYALGQIERLTPQALTIISDYKNWPEIKLTGFSVSMGPKVTTDWYSEFTLEYCRLRGIIEEQKYKRVMHSVVELQRQGFMEAFNGQDQMTYCQLTHVGQDLIPYIS